MGYKWQTVKHRLSAAGLEHIKQFEAFVPYVYLDQAGLPTIGYGHLIKSGESFTTVTMGQALELLRLDVEEAENAVNAFVTVPLTQSQFDALVSFVFNIGAGAFKSSTALRRLNAGDYIGATEAMGWFNKVTLDGEKIVSAGLVSRRASEQQNFWG